MKVFSRIGGLVAAVIGIVASSACVSAGKPAATGEAARSSLTDLVSMLSGRFQGTTPGNALNLDLGTVGARTGTRFDLFLTTSGRYRDTNVRRAGLLRLETQGRDVHAAYVPHFDPTVTSLSLSATRFSEEELRSACSFYFQPSGDGYFGETRGSTICAQAMPGAAGKWTIEVEPGSIRVRNVASGETLRFAKTTK
jgi:hypothetical protein